VTSAEHWLLGRPDPDYPRQTRTGVFDTLAELTQRDWQIAYDQYQLVDGRLVPERITLTHAPLELRLRITDFEPVLGEP
jgi:outer membrane biogenesis lipoprotein LolB